MDQGEQRFLNRGVAPRLLTLAVVFAALAPQASKRLKAERERVTQKTAHLFTVVGFRVSTYEFMGHRKTN